MSMRIPGQRSKIKCPAGTLADVVAVKQAPGFYALFEDGTVFAGDEAAFHGNASLPSQRYAVDIEVDPSGKGYHVLLSDGRVISLGDVEFPGWRDEGGGTFVAFSPHPAGKTWYGLTREGRMVSAGQPPAFQIWDFPYWGWDIGRDILATYRGVYVLDGFGGIHNFGGEFRIIFPGYRPKDTYVALQMLSDGRLSILDDEGEVHYATRPKTGME